MGNYLVHHTKKKRVLARKELALQRLVDSAAPSEKLIAAAEEVRDARIRVLRVRRSMIPPMGDAETQYAKIDRQVERLSATPATTILSEFSCSSDENGNSNDGATST